MRIPLFQSLSNFFTNMFTLQDTFVDNTDGHASTRRNLLFGGFFSALWANLVAGVYFTSLMLAMGASESYIGYTTTIASFCGLFQFLSPLIFERFPRRKGLILTFRGVYAFLNIAVIGVVPLLPIANHLKLILFMVALAIMNITANLVSPAMSIWHYQCLPASKRTNFLAVNNITSTMFSYISSLSAGILLDKFELAEISWGNLSPTLTAILLLRGVALIMAVFENVFFAKMKEDPYAVSPNADNRIGIKFLLTPLKNRKFMASISIMLLWTLFTALMGQYYTIYLLEDIQMSYTLLSLSSFVSLPIYFISNPTWSRIIRRNRWSKVLMTAQLLYITPYICNALVTPNSIALYFVSVFSSLLISPGITLSHTNLLYDNMPDENRTTYLSLYSVLIQLTTFISQYIGIQIFTLTDGASIRLLGLDMINKQYMNLVIGSLLVVVCLHTGTIVRKFPPKD